MQRVAHLRDLARCSCANRLLRRPGPVYGVSPISVHTRRWLLSVSMATRNPWAAQNRLAPLRRRPEHDRSNSPDRPTKFRRRSRDIQRSVLNHSEQKSPWHERCPRGARRSVWTDCRANCPCWLALSAQRLGSDPDRSAHRLFSACFSPRNEVAPMKTWFTAAKLRSQHSAFELRPSPRILEMGTITASLLGDLVKQPRIAEDRWLNCPPLAHQRSDRGSS